MEEIIKEFTELIAAILRNIWVTGGGTALTGGSALGYMIYTRKKKEKNGGVKPAGNGNGKVKDPIIAESQCKINRREIYDEFKRVRESQALNQAQIINSLGEMKGEMKQLVNNVNSLIQKGLQ